MLITIGEPGDPEDDPTVLWPKDRKELKVGTLTILSAMPQIEAGSYNINYDPLVMGDGIAPTNDPILLFRSPSYALFAHQTPTQSLAFGVATVTGLNLSGVSTFSFRRISQNRNRGE
jgi:hypothetical protein